MPLAERLLDSLQGRAGRRVKLAELQALVVELDPALRTAPEKRERLAEAIEVGEERELLKTPISKKLWTGNPPLPQWVQVAGEIDRTPATIPGASVFWRPELAWASELRFRPGEIEFVKRVNTWLRDLDPQEPVIPMRERSLEIAGDEKAIQGMLGGRLFRPDRLSLSFLRCAPTTPPFGYAEIGPAPVLLAIENQDTYWSLRRLLRPEHGIGLVAYGAGNVFTSSVLYIGELSRPVWRTLYFGDVDGKGLETPIVAGVVAGRHDLPPVEPCARLYRLLFALANPSPSEARRLGLSAARHRSAWLPADLHSEAVQILSDGQRLPQEAVGYKALAAALAEPFDLTDTR